MGLLLLAAAVVGGGAVDVGDGVGQVGADRCDGDDVGGAFLACFGFPVVLSQVAGDDDWHAFGDGVGGVGGKVAPCFAPQEGDTVVDPLVLLLVPASLVAGDGECGDGVALWGVAQFGVGGDVSGELDVWQCHGVGSFLEDGFGLDEQGAL